MLKGILRLATDGFIEFVRGAFGVRLQAPSTLSSDIVLELPSAITNGEYIAKGTGNSLVSSLLDIPYLINPVRVCVAGAYNFTFPSNVVDGVTLATGDRFLVNFQADPKDNGVYIWDGTTPARASDMATGRAVPLGALVLIQEGNIFANNLAIVSTAPNSIGTDPIEFSFYPNVLGLGRYYTTTVVGGGTRVIDHSLESRYGKLIIISDTTDEIYRQPDDITFIDENSLMLDLTSIDDILRIVYFAPIQIPSNLSYLNEITPQILENYANYTMPFLSSPIVLLGIFSIRFDPSATPLDYTIPALSHTPTTQFAVPPAPDGTIIDPYIDFNVNEIAPNSVNVIVTGDSTAFNYHPFGEQSLLQVNFAITPSTEIMITAWQMNLIIDPAQYGDYLIILQKGSSGTGVLYIDGTPPLADITSNYQFVAGETYLTTYYTCVINSTNTEAIALSDNRLFSINFTQAMLNSVLGLPAIVSNFDLRVLVAYLPSGVPNVVSRVIDFYFNAEATDGSTTQVHSSNFLFTNNYDVHFAENRPILAEPNLYLATFTETSSFSYTRTIDTMLDSTESSLELEELPLTIVYNLISLPILPTISNIGTGEKIVELIIKLDSVVHKYLYLETDGSAIYWVDNGSTPSTAIKFDTGATSINLIGQAFLSQPSFYPPASSGSYTPLDIAIPDCRRIEILVSVANV